MRTEEHLAVTLDAVTRTYSSAGGDVHALRGVELSIRSGSMVALRGRSGSGKTTLLNIVGGIDQPTSGTATVLGTELNSLPVAALADWRRTNLGFVFQNHGLMATMSASENVELALRIAGVDRRERRERVDRHLGLVGLLDWADHRPDELSGGQQQRVALARAAATHARLIIADEPTGELDVETGAEVLNALRNTVDTTGTTIIVATHDPAVDRYADSVLHLSDGVIA